MVVSYIDGGHPSTHINHERLTGLYTKSIMTFEL